MLDERLGQQVMRLGLTPRQSFHAVSAVLGFVIGIAADLGQQPPLQVIDGTIGRDEHIKRYADQWRQLDAATFPFMHLIVDEFAVHDDATSSARVSISCSPASASRPGGDVRRSRVNVGSRATTRVPRWPRCGVGQRRAQPRRTAATAQITGVTPDRVGRSRTSFHRKARSRTEPNAAAWAGPGRPTSGHRLRFT